MGLAPMPFAFGQLLATPVALSHLAQHEVLPTSLLERHLRGDWSELNVSDKRSNDLAVASGERILSSYVVSGVKLYIVTEWDRNCTTIMLASEY